MRPVPMLMLALLATPVAAQTAPATTDPITVTGDTQKKKVCTQVASATGSMMPRRVCRTKGEQAETDKRNGRAKDEYFRGMQSGSSISAPNQAN